MKLHWTRPALRDLEMIGEYVARDNPVAADALMERILEQVEVLKRHPEIGRVGRVTGTRELIVSATPYVIPYRVRHENVEVLAVFHGARKWPEDFD